MEFDAMKFSAFLKAVICPEKSSKPFSPCDAVHVATYLSLACYSGVESALNFAKWTLRTSEVNCLILLIMNEIYPNAQIIPFIEFHSAITPSVGQAVPQNT